MKKEVPYFVTKQLRNKMNKEQLSTIQKEAELQASLHVHKDIYYDRWRTGVCCYIAGRTVGIDRERELEKSLRSLILTASKFWDEIKPIKDTQMMTVTHPTIEDAKNLLNNK